MKYTLLDMVQDILSEMDSDEVNSLSDTVESEQVAKIIKSTYFEMISNRNWPHLKKLIKLSASTSVALPTHVTITDKIKELIFIKYDVRKGDDTKRLFKDMKYITPEDFLFKTNNRNSDESNMLVVLDPAESVELIIRTDKAPEFFTTFDDESMVFDSYDSATSSTMISTRFQAQAYITPSWTHSDTFTPDLPIEAFSALLEESKSVCFHTLKQMNNDKAEQKARRQQRWLSQKAWSITDEELYPDFGRKRAARNTNPYIDKNN